jgi:hypothetical protein
MQAACDKRPRLQFVLEQTTLVRLLGNVSGMANLQQHLA